MMHVAVSTPPDPVVSLDGAKQHLGVTHDDDDDLIDAYVAAATAVLDGPDGVLNRALSQQTLQATIEGFPAAPLTLRCEPVQEITSVTYVDADGATQTVDEDVYELTADGRFRRAFDQDWPATRSDQDPVTITYVAGFASLPGPLRAAILIMVADLYAQRETNVVGDQPFAVQVPTSVERLILPFRKLRA